ncbi:hypothetical protein FJT64_023843 [Amphibalanus amphitrite]|uniref:Uncharacterized protein n=1 Tax=Amphibalanus amphitrite TaxID=1232801 RepID=A0A6A4WCG3_AMPAM|nr:hypothetical protein FJT64_023843 [Amphibalanus amphitrite]
MIVNHPPRSKVKFHCRYLTCRLAARCRRRRASTMTERFKVTAASTNSSYGALEDGKEEPSDAAAADQPAPAPASPGPSSSGPFGPTTYVHQKAEDEKRTNGAAAAEVKHHWVLS